MLRDPEAVAREGHPMRRAMVLPVAALVALAGAPAHAEVVGNGCSVRLVLAPEGRTASCTFTAPTPGYGTHGLTVYGGGAVSEVTCTVGYDYLGQVAGHGWSWEYYREGTCVLTLTAWSGTTTATASAD